MRRSEFSDFYARGATNLRSSVKFTVGCFTTPYDNTAQDSRSVIEGISRVYICPSTASHLHFSQV